MNSLNVKIAGQAGEGIKSVGLVLSKTFVRAGYWTFDYTEYPSLIRGGHNTYQSHISTTPVYSQIKKVDLLIALNRETVDLHQEELVDNSLVIYDPGEFKVDDAASLKGKYLSIPLIELAVKVGGKPVMANNVALGAVMFLTGMSIEILKGVIGEVFADKPEVIAPNHKAAQAGWQYAQEKLSQFKISLDKPTSKEKKMLLTGNESIALGAIAGGMKFYAAYPMTPSTSILHYLAAKAKDCKLVVKHASDEITVINMALGASFAGVRTMVATSGGGFSLMTEAFGMAGMMELPLVLVEGMRSGPSSGMPTWHGQGDLLFLIRASQGEFPRMVFTPGDVSEAFELTRQAFYYAEKYQIPVVVLTDKYLAESPASVKQFQTTWSNQRYSFVTQKTTDFKRYQVTQNGISPRSIPGQPGLHYLSNSYEHTEKGYATEESLERNKMVDKRMRKFETLIKETSKRQLPIYGNPQAAVGIISWGTNKGPILQALSSLKDKVAFLHLDFVWPFPRQQVADFLSHKRQILTIECNATGQLNSLIREQLGIKIKDKLLKYDGRPFYPEEIISKLNSFQL